jgi:carboxyl-terminal processing protease
VWDETVLGWRRQADDNWDFIVDARERIGYVRLGMFRWHTIRDVALILSGLEEQGLTALVLDLRFCSGGPLLTARDLCNLFLEEGPSFVIRERGKPPEVIDPGGLASHPKLPLVCLVGEETRGMAEVIAACLQDHGRAVIVGEHTRGGPGVQNITFFHDTEIYCTVAEYVRPNGKPIGRLLPSGTDEDEWGVTPDKGFLLPQTSQQRNDLERQLSARTLLVHHDPSERPAVADVKDPQLDAALEYLRGRIKKEK